MTKRPHPQVKLHADDAAESLFTVYVNDGACAKLAMNGDGTYTLRYGLDGKKGVTFPTQEEAVEAIRGNALAVLHGRRLSGYVDNAEAPLPAAEPEPEPEPAAPISLNAARAARRSPTREMAAAPAPEATPTEPDSVPLSIGVPVVITAKGQHNGEAGQVVKHWAPKNTWKVVLRDGSSVWLKPSQLRITGEAQAIPEAVLRRQQAVEPRSGAPTAARALSLAQALASTLTALYDTEDGITDATKAALASVSFGGALARAIEALDAQVRQAR